MIRYDKLVRDRIPEMIRENGETPLTEILDEEQFRNCLEQKLDEEVREFHGSGDLEELADILEVIYALSNLAGCSMDELEEIRRRKWEERGGFDQRIFLIGKE